MRTMMSTSTRIIGLLSLMGVAACTPAPPVAAPVMSVEPKSAVVPQEERDTLEGRVVWKGPLPQVANFENRIRQHVDKAHFLKMPNEQMLDPTLVIDAKTRGVANAVVYFKRPKDGTLPINPEDRVRKNEVVIDIPFCSFEPYMTAFYPVWDDGKESGETGQDLIFRNSSPVFHAVRVWGHPKYNFGFHKNLPPNTKLCVMKDLPKENKLNPQPLPLSLNGSTCSWMRGYVWVFDHPYFAISQADGSFTIPRVPAGLEVQVMAWHEAEGWLFTKDGKTMTMKKGKNTLDIEMSAK